MSRLCFANISEAYNIGSEQIKKRQDEIDNLKKIISENSIPQNKQDTTQNTPPKVINPQEPQYVKQTNQSNSIGVPVSEDFEYSFYKLANNPKFEQTVKNYIIINHPEWLINNSSNNKNTQDNTNKSNFGNVDIDKNIKNYLMFFMFSIIIYLLLSIIINKTK